MATVDIDLSEINLDGLQAEIEDRGMFSADSALDINAAYEAFRGNRLDKDQFLRDLFYSALGRIA